MSGQPMNTLQYKEPCKGLLHYYVNDIVDYSHVILLQINIDLVYSYICQLPFRQYCILSSEHFLNKFFYRT